VADLAASIVIVTYNAPDKVRECLEALTGDSAPAVPHEVLVLDNASSPSLVPLLREYLPAGQVVDVGENVGFGRGCNLGAARARGRYIVLVNPDAVVEPGAIDALVRAADAEPRCGVVGGRTVDPEGRTDPKSCWAAPSVWSYLCFATLLSTAFAGNRFLDPESLGDWQRDSVRDVPIITGCLMAVPRDLWNELGGFDPDFFMYGEDADLCLRVLRAGRRVWFEPGSVAMHVWGSSSASSGAKTTLLLAGRMTYVRKDFAGWRRPVARQLLIAGVALRATLDRARRRPETGWAVAWGRRAEWVDGFPPVGAPALTPQA
jgi:N-acetylglucosaminyl-diphospho-decaprenol L-rhamnosyltransferase